MSLKKKLLYLLVLLFGFLVNAQNTKGVSPLKNILNLISIQHDVRFNYIEDEIAIYELKQPEKKWSLEQKIAYLKEKTSLEFKLINERYYSIYNNKNLDKPLCAYLLDSETEMPIENAVVSIDKTTTNTFTNENGYFELPKLSTNIIKVQHQGYIAIEINPKDLNIEKCPTYKLIPIIQILDEVATERYLTTGISKKTDGSTVIKPKKFGILPGLIEPDVLQTMQQIPGIMSVDETISNINVRGGTHDQNLFLWNGIRMFQTGHFFGLISAFNPSLAQNISISKNGSSAFFGESVSSVIDISSRTSTTEKNNSSFSSNFISAEFYTQLKLTEKASLTFSGRRSMTDFFSSPTYKNYSNRIFQNTEITNLNENQTVDFDSDVEFYFYDFTIQYQQKIGKKHRFNFDFIMIENSLDFEKKALNIFEKSHLEQHSFGSTLQWQTQWNEKNSTEFHGYVSHYDLIASNEDIVTIQNLNQRNKVVDFGFQIKNSTILSNTLKLNTGYQFNEIGVTNFDEINVPLFSRTITNVLLSHIAIAEGIYETEDKKNFLKAGLRSNYFGKFSTVLIEPRIQFNRALSNNLRLEILGELKSQTVSQIIDLQQDFLGLEKRRWTLANSTTVPIQKSHQISIGFNYKKNNWLLTMDTFYKKVTGISSSSQGFQNQFELERSVGNYQVIGSEFFIQKTFKKFYSWLSYSFNDNQYDFEQPINGSFPNNFEIKHAISWAGIYEWKKIKLALGAKWHSGRPITTPQSLTVTDTEPSIKYNQPNNTNLQDYFQGNFSASKKWQILKKNTLETAISVLNIFNTRNSINRFYRVNTSDNTVESVDTFSLEMTPNLNIKLSF
jgi:hypothetical protein